MIIQPILDPTCKIARFHAKLKSQVGSDCGNYKTLQNIAKRYKTFGETVKEASAAETI